MYETFCKLNDPRVVGRSSHKLTDILILSVLAVICGADTYDAIELFGRAHEEELKKILDLPNGIPSHDTINRVFQSISTRHFEQLFSEWASGLCQNGKAGTVVSIDGKTMRGSKDTFHGKSPLHIVSAWSVANALCLGQFKTGDKETTEVRYYIRSLPPQSPFNTYIRSHWEIENKLHWTLDMTLGEDQQRKRSKMAAQNFSLIR